MILMLAHIGAGAQEKEVLTFAAYMDSVRACNISYLAEKYNVDIAEANVKAAKVFPDPELSVSYGNNQNWNLQMGYGVDAELSYTLELGRKRKARVMVAQSEREMAGALLEDYFRNLRADASIAYLAALRQKQLCRIQQSSYEQIKEVARADSLRFLSGAITEVDAQQSRLEASTMLNDVFSAEGDLKDALAQLQLYQGSKHLQPIDSIAGELSYTKVEAELPDLLIEALNTRADLQAAMKSRDVSHNNLRLAKANRFIDLGINLGGSYASEVKNEIAPAPEFKGFTVGFTVPLKFSNTNKGALRAAKLAAQQSEAQYEATELQISTEVTQAFNKYKTTCRQVEQYDTGMLREAESVYRKKAYSYSRGETSILELLNARRAYNDIQTSYTDALYNNAAALVELERASGMVR